MARTETALPLGRSGPVDVCRYSGPTATRPVYAPGDQPMRADPSRPPTVAWARGREARAAGARLILVKPLGLVVNLFATATSLARRVAVAIPRYGNHNIARQFHRLDEGGDKSPEPSDDWTG